MSWKYKNNINNDDDSASYLGTKGYCVATCEPSFYNL